ncbi:MAG: L-lactate transport [Actinomycetia bacterium]|nr:L-lactate transport [Actinomycetes bacterium]
MRRPAPVAIGPHDPGVALGLDGSAAGDHYGVDHSAGHPQNAMYKQVLEPVGHSLAWSSLVAALPLVVLFVPLGVVRMRAWTASLVALAVALVMAIAVYGMPVEQSLLAGSEGAAFGFFPILWIGINAIWVYTMTVQTGHFDVLRRSFGRVSDDQRIQAIIIAFSFGH